MRCFKERKEKGRERSMGHMRRNGGPSNIPDEAGSVVPASKRRLEGGTTTERVWRDRQEH